MSNYTPKALYHAVEAAARDLPKGWGINLSIERHGWGVDLVNPEGDKVDIESYSIVEDILEAIKKAREN